MPGSKVARVQKIAARKFWRPRRPELAEPCVSCPFREGNDLEFGEIIRRLRLMQTGQKFSGPVTAEEVAYARNSVRKELEFSGEFMCHGTVYDEHMRQKPSAGFRQCAGAARCYREAKTHL